MPLRQNFEYQQYMEHAGAKVCGNGQWMTGLARGVGKGSIPFVNDKPGRRHFDEHRFPIAVLDDRFGQ